MVWRPADDSVVNRKVHPWSWRGCGRRGNETHTSTTDPKRRWSVTQILEHIAEAELRERARKSLERRVGRSKLGGFKPLAEFDWAWPKHIDCDAVESAARLEFLADARNVVLVAPQGLGKTMIAQNIVHAALLAGHGALFVTSAQMLLDLGAQESTCALDRRLRFYTSQPLLCIDEIGCAPRGAMNRVERDLHPGPLQWSREAEGRQSTDMRAEPGAALTT